MQQNTTSYVHRGDGIRRKERIRKVLLVVGLAGAVALIPRERPRDAQASSLGMFSFTLTSQTRHLRTELDATRGQLALARAQLQRANAILAYSAKYKVGADIAAPVYDIALAEGIEPDLGFRLVRVESEFNPHAISSAGAIGLTQVMPATARYFDKSVTREKLYDPRTNLRVGFAYLRSLIDQYHGDLRLALLVYNRGPLAVETLQSLGVDPRNGYEAAVMKGYEGDGTVN